MAAVEITSINQVMDSDDTVGFFEVTMWSTSNHEQPPEIVMNYEGNPDLVKVHQWLSKNNQGIPDYSSFIAEE
jgi:hypothetical protein